MAYASKRSPQTSQVTATSLWSCWASTPTTSPSSTGTSPGPPETRSRSASSPPAAACRSSWLTAADRLDDKASGFELGADDYLTKPFELRELVLRLRALDRRRAHNRPPVREIAGLRLDPFRREVYRDGRYVALTRKQFAVLEVLVAAEGGVVSAEELLARAWDENADPFTNAVRITVSGLRKRLGEPGIVATVAGVGYRIDTAPGTRRGGEDRG
jgi:two-component system, OmpR family, response regulator VanR